ncbi:MAG: anthranilate phosphoribosyltransferase [Limnospira sp. PMC 1291.21]|uniref:Anthranilate phosphoribosyltransferase n=1 Tax=Limnospira indica PCC 8005 TaxID=376219 RepID=A0A9P1KL28_9CYAN|nr:MULTISPECIES: anthranilate phosphoribosyltransferase [Limnospira]EKD08979.1 anthranilate phosphoribosyltransferase [Arthrospira platensis C1]MDY7051790.1 anthranilate phosphoribosyltransferase [Limnospira fusiformis LS22]MDT9176513.1 anthranilate phosphoribosyltransferase [Limnospira sp. PMC 1238.20]MDT9186232.1 anthranilate phosphoribosyltransferase [Limnospira sp. PMC 894.15]MDT9191610.1 anthranilate phosphoribosyltransferase [Limnospira sp. PMC 1245.20]
MTHSAPDADIWPQLLQQLLDHQSLSTDQASMLMEGWLSESIPPVLSGAILVALQTKGVSGEELAGMAKVLQAQSQSGNLPTPGADGLKSKFSLIDTCGTGGDGASTFNISTAVAFVCAAAGVPVAKHGNRSASSKVGSADVLEGLGVNLGAPLEKVRAAVEQVGITFLFAPGWHPAMKAVAPLRRTLKVRTVFNLLGPLVNPLRPVGQVIGVFDPSVLDAIAQALGHLNIERAIVLHGREGLDEAGLADGTDLAILSEGKVMRSLLNPEDLGINAAPISALKGGELADNMEILTQVLQGKGTTPQQDAVALNSSLALQVAGVVPLQEHHQGYSLALDILQSGAAWSKLQELIKFLN